MLQNKVHPWVRSGEVRMRCGLPPAHVPEPSRESFQQGGFAFVRGRAWHSKNWQKLHWFIVFHASIWGGLQLCLGGL